MAMAAVDDGEPGHGREQVLRDSGCAWPVAAPAAARRADHQRHRDVSEHAGELHGVVVELVHAERQEVREHHLGHRQEAGEREPDRRAGDARLADRRGDHAARERRRQALSDLERAAVGVVQVLAEQQRARVRFQQVLERGIERLAHVDARGQRRIARARVGALGDAKMFEGTSP